jgi:predicted dehydrogenase
VDALGVAVIGAGYWGPNLIRNVQASTDCRLQWVCDLDVARAQRAVGAYSTVRISPSLEEVLADPAVEAVLIATPAHTHLRIALAALEAGKHVLVEKPLASSAEEGAILVASAKARGLVLMADHTYCYTPAVRRIRELVEQGELGEIQFVDSVRINLGLIQPDVDVFWDLAPHDLSILDYVLPQGMGPTAVAAQGADPVGAGRSCMGYLTMPLRGSAIAHAHVNWLSPTKIRTTIIGGSKRTLVWDDLDPVRRLSIYDRGVDLDVAAEGETRRQALVSYRTGDMIAPALPEREALREVVREFAGAIREGRAPATDGAAGLRVLELLEAATTSLARGGALVPVGTSTEVAA